jgi:hypothetical protein
MTSTTSFGGLLQALAGENVQFILVGGLAGVAHGSGRATLDVDVVYGRNAVNLGSLVRALKDYQPYLRGVPPGLPFRWDAATLRNGLNFTLTTSLGDIDLLGEVAGGGNYDQLFPFSIELSLFGQTCRCVSLEKLIQLKRAAGRAKDLEAIAELQALLEERPEQGQA